MFGVFIEAPASVSLWVSLRYAHFSSDLNKFRSDLVTSVFNKERIGDRGEASFLVFPSFGAGFWGRLECHFCIKIAQIWLDKVRRFFQSGWKLTRVVGFFHFLNAMGFAHSVLFNSLSRNCQFLRFDQ